jgi:hypothetical protein
MNNGLLLIHSCHLTFSDGVRIFIRDASPPLCEVRGLSTPYHSHCTALFNHERRSIRCATGHSESQSGDISPPFKPALLVFVWQTIVPCAPRWPSLYCVRIPHPVYDASPDPPLPLLLVMGSIEIVNRSAALLVLYRCTMSSPYSILHTVPKPHRC